MVWLFLTFSDDFQKENIFSGDVYDRNIFLFPILSSASLREIWQCHERWDLLSHL